MSLNEICRTCLQPTRSQLTLWDVINPESEGDYEPKPIVIVDLLKSMPRIDFIGALELPNKICMLCMNRMKTICSFIVNCENNEKILKKVLAEEDKKNVALKFEPPTVASSTKRRKKCKELNEDNVISKENVKLPFVKKENDEIQCPIDTIIKTETLQEEDLSNDNSEDLNATQSTIPTYIKEEPELELEPDIIDLSSSDSEDEDDSQGDFVFDVEDELETFYSYVERANARLWCSKCEGQFPTKRLYDAHLLECNKLLECDECLMTFQNSVEYEKHCQIAHAQMDLSQSDHTLSDGEINTKENIYSNMSSTINQGSGKNAQYQCPHCPKTFDVEKRLASHIKCHNKSHCCAKCVKSFRSSHHLKAHNMRVHGASWKSIHCGVCKRYFACNADYVRHQLTHTKEKPYECNKCPERYRYKKFLENHIRQSHPEVSEQETLDYIQVRYGGKKLPELLESTFKCIVCEQSVDRANLAEHVNSHKRK